MAEHKRRRRLISRVVLAVAFIAGVCFSAVDAPPAAAQGFGWLGGLFGGGTPQRQQGAPAFPGFGEDGAGSRYYNPPRRRAQRKKPADSSQDAAAKPKAPAKNATLFVDVYGDSMGQLLANGLDDALADRPEVGIVHKAKGSTGLVTTSFYDWPKAIEEQLSGKKEKGDDGKAKEAKAKDPKAKTDGADTKKTEAKKADDKKPDDKKADDKTPKDKVDVAVMMIGVNDRQTLIEDGKKMEPGSDEWTAAYKKRVMAINEAFARKKIPLIWVGIPITKDDNFADDMAALNDIYRDAASKTGATYVDTWEAFSDDNGNFAAYGPDINGQTTRLRAGDGIHFTKAGGRKLAHFVETHVRRDLDGKAPLPQLPTAAVAPDDKTGDKKAGEKKEQGPGAKPAVAVVKPEAGPIKDLAEAPSTKDGHLTEPPKDTNLANYLGKAPENAPAGRVDNFKWPPNGAPSEQ